MPSIPRLCALTGLTCLLAALAFAAPASAADAQATCVTAGGMKTNPPIQLVGGSGAFTYSSLTAVCVGVKKGTPAVEVDTLTASGTYTNVVCGTGKLVGTITSGTGMISQVRGKKFAVELVAFAGPMYFHQWANPALPDTKVLDLIFPTTPNKRWKPVGVFVGSYPDPLLKPFTPPAPPLCTKALDAEWGFYLSSPKLV